MIIMVMGLTGTYGILILSESRNLFFETNKEDVLRRGLIILAEHDQELKGML